MKKLTTMAMLAAACAAHAAIVSVEVGKGETAPLEAARAVAAQAVSTNATGTVTVKRVTPLDVEWFEEAVVTNFTYRPATSNVQYTATETLWRAWTTNAYAVATGSMVGVTFVTNVATVVTGTVWSAATGLSNLTHTVTNVTALTNAVPLVRTGIVSNMVGQAWGAKPFVAGWPTNDLLYTSQSVTHALSSNVTYQVVDTVDVRTERTRHVASLAVTNTLWSATLSGGFKTNALDAVIYRGDYLVGEGTALDAGKVQLLLEW